MNAPWYGDLGLAVVLFFAAFGKAVTIAMIDHSVERWLILIGWLGLTSRIIVGLAMDGDVPINAASYPFLLALAGGSLIATWQQIQIERTNLRCLREPSLRCAREDRVRVATLERRKR